MTGLTVAIGMQWFSGFFTIEALNTLQRKQRFVWGEVKPFFFLSYLSWIPYRPPSSGGHKPQAENHCCKHTHKSSSGTKVVCRLLFTFVLSLRTASFSGQELPFSVYNAQHSKDLISGDNTGTLTRNNNNEWT